MSDGGEFSIELQMDIRQHMRKRKTKQHRVGRCFITFHCTPKDMYRRQRSRVKERASKNLESNSSDTLHRDRDNDSKILLHD